MDIEIRSAFVAQERDVALGLRVAQGQESWIETVEDCLKEADTLPMWRPVTLYADGLIVGFAMYGLFPDDMGGESHLWLDRLLIDGAQQHKGYGEAALCALLARLAQSYGPRDVYLSLYDDNAVAMHLYEKHGFTPTGERDEKGEKIMIKRAQIAPLADEPPARPTPAQLRWQNCEMGAFFHFGMNTFCDQEWGEGQDDPQKFAPSALDCDAWVRAVKRAGFRYVVLTAKHHDGFCLWPTRTTDYSVKSSPFGGDVVGLLAQACRRHNMPLGLYLSPWDRHEPCYASEAAYDDFYCVQLTELLTQYGELFELWFDGAGSTGRHYNWERIMGLIQQHQPNAMVFNMGRPTIRWVGNEDGLAPDTCVNGAVAARESMYTDDMATWLPDTPRWVPAECDVAMRRAHWFWHPEDEGSLLSLDELLDIHDRSVGHGANLLLNIAPDRHGRLPQVDVERLLVFGEVLRERYAQSVGQTYGCGYDIQLDTDDAVIERIVIMEDIMLGEFISHYGIDALVDGQWQQIAQGTSIGHKRIVRIEPMCATRLRLRVECASATPQIVQFAAYAPAK